MSAYAFSINVTCLGRDGIRCRRIGHHPLLPSWRTSGLQITPDGGPVDAQLPFDCPQRHALAPGFLDRLPSLPLKEDCSSRDLVDGIRHVLWESQSYLTIVGWWLCCDGAALRMTHLGLRSIILHWPIFALTMGCCCVLPLCCRRS